MSIDLSANMHTESNLTEIKTKNNDNLEKDSEKKNPARKKKISKLDTENDTENSPTQSKTENKNPLECDHLNDLIKEVNNDDNNLTALSENSGPTNCIQIETINKEIVNQNGVKDSFQEKQKLNLNLKTGPSKYKNDRFNSEKNTENLNSNKEQDRRQENSFSKPFEPIKQIFKLSQLQDLSTQSLADLADKDGIENARNMRRQKLLFNLLKVKFNQGYSVLAEGILEVVSDGYGFLRDPSANYQPGEDDVYISPAIIRRFGLRSGMCIEADVRLPKDNEKYLTALKITSVEKIAPEDNKNLPLFEDLTPIHPQKMIHLERDIRADENITGRLIDIISPIGFGQRGLLVAPPKAGKTVMMQHIAHSIAANHPDAHLIVLLIDERPEEVTEMARSVRGEVIASTFDEPAERHVQVAEMVIEKAKRLAERKKDVIILLDSITRLARAYNTCQPNSGRVLSGGVEAQALQRPKRFFGAARCLEEGGSLTIVATALVETGSKMDEVIYEEFKGTGNMEIHMDRRLTERRIYPAVNIAKSGTRREELLLSPEALQKTYVLRKIAAGLNDDLSASEFVISKLRDSKSNNDFFDLMKR